MPARVRGAAASLTRSLRDGLRRFFELYEDDVRVGGPDILAGVNVRRRPHGLPCLDRHIPRIVADGQPTPKARQKE